LSVDNPIGFGGRIAWSFGELVRAIQQSTNDVVMPVRLKSDIGICHPEFGGFRQHDAQVSPLLKSVLLHQRARGVPLF
jgi:hypothetical protein